MQRMKPTVLALALLGTSILAPSANAADGSASMRVGDMQYGNGLDPSGWAPLLWPADRNGFSWLHAGMLRTPSGMLYPYPPARDDAADADSGAWHHWGVLQLGYLGVSGDKHAEFFRQYTDWRSGLVLGLLALNVEQASSGKYLELRASHLSPDDQYLRVRAGRAGHYKVEAFYRDMPHTVATNAYPLWQGVGSTALTLPTDLTPGGSSAADVAATAAAAPRRDIKLVRTRSGIGIEAGLSRHWIGYANVTNEDRKGTRLWGGPMFFNYPFPANGGALETVRPIDFRTTDINLGLRNVGKTWRFNAVYTGSFFRNHKNHLDFQSPFALWNVVGTPPVGNIYQGQFSLEPNNDYHNLRLELSRSLQHNGELSLAAAWGTMRQNDALLAPVTCTGQGGIFIAPPADFTFNCADWNAPAALSRRSAEARIDTGLLNAKLSFRPSSRFGWHANLRWYREDNRTNYLAFNPLTGQYGYISENGAQGSVVPGETGIFDPTNPLYRSYVAQVKNVPFAYDDTLFELGADWRVSDNNSLNLTYSFDHNQPKHRERKRVDEQRLKLAWVNRAIGKATLRTSIERAHRSGDTYNYDPYEEFMSIALPGFVPAANGIAAFTTDAMRKYDLSDRDETKYRAILIYPVGDSATVSATAHGIHDDYRTDIGRQNTRNDGLTVQWDWQPAPETNLGAWLGLEKSRLGIANVGDVEALVGNDPAQQDPSLGGPLYPLANQWWEHLADRDRNLGFTWNHDFGGGVRANIGYTWTFTTSQVGYRYASTTAIAGTQRQFAAQVGNGFPDNHYRVNTLDFGLDIPLSPRIGMHWFGRLQAGDFFDWHYLGLDDTPVIDHRIYTDRGPNGSWNASVVGVLFNVKL
ncbi:MAG TPA: MtrB/PioB family outer membrane beta-barrel protein [Rhodanobacteraceae bacterium]|nr:MtrB/PioB family outer membrane beta-barrel protein [Rhodanobacteraceae bacterium]